MSIVNSEEQQTVLEVGKSTSSDSKLTNFLKTTKLPFLKKLFESKISIATISHRVLHNALLENQFPYEQYGDKMSAIGMGGHYETTKNAKCFLGGYLDIKTDTQFLVSKDLTCCGVTHFLGFQANFEHTLKQILSGDLQKLIPKNYSIDKAKEFYKETMFQYMIYRAMYGRINSIFKLSSLSVDQLIALLKEKANTGTYQYRGIVAPSNLFLKNENSDYTKLGIEDAQGAAYLAFKEMPYFEEKSRFVNANSNQTCINYEALFYTSELIEVLIEYKKLWEQNLIQ